MATVSHWRQRSRAVICATLALLPADADEETKRAAVSAAYPFGERRMHPYRIWCDEVACVLGKRGRKKEMESARIDPKEMAVECPWCEKHHQAVCFGCASLQEQLRLRGDSIDWLTWWRFEERLQQPPEDRVHRAMYADWLEENGFPSEAKRIRKGG